jgi:uncharacterized heparinase superfamily protein
MSRNYLWYLRRLQAMSLAEITYRLRQQAVLFQERRRNVANANTAVTDGWEIFRQGEPLPTLPGFLTTERQAYWQKQFPQGYESTLAIAGQIVGGTLSLLGCDISISADSVWQQDPRSHRAWPDAFHADVDTRDGRTIGGVKWVWELNRHHHLVTLGKAYCLTDEEQFAAEACRQIESWIDGNPPLRGVNWSNALELAVRLINWCWTLAMVRSSAALTPEFFARVQQSIVAQASYIARHLSGYSSANNHLIGEAAGLAVVGFCFPWLPEAEKWQSTGLNVLERELSRQIYPDGVPAEQAISYLAFILDFNLLAWRLAELSGRSVAPIWPIRLSAACDFIATIMDEKGHVPGLGDSDDAWVVRLDDRPETNNYRSILASAAVLLNRPDLKGVAGCWDEKSHWLLGEDGRQKFEQLSGIIPELVSYSFATGGYSVMRAPGCVITVDHGPLGYLSTAAHGHADALSLTVSLDGRPFLIDPGTYAYQEGEAWRDFYRSTAAHNTVEVDGQNQSERLGTFLWGRKAAGRLHQWRSTTEYDFCLTSHDGYTSSMGVTHRRAVYFHKPYWLLIMDCLSGNGNHHLAQWWHFHPRWRVEMAGEFFTISDQSRINWLWTSATKTETAATRIIRTGETDPIQGWYSARYGHQEPAPVLTVSGSFQLPVQLVALFCFDEQMTAVEFRRQKAQILRSFENVWQEVEH